MTIHCSECGAAFTSHDGERERCPNGCTDGLASIGEVEAPRSASSRPAPVRQRRGRTPEAREAPRAVVPRFVMGPETLNRAALPEGSPPAIVCWHCRKSVAFAFSKDPPAILIKCGVCGWEIGIGLPGVLFGPASPPSAIVTPEEARRMMPSGLPALGPAAADVEAALRRGPR